MSSGVFLYLIFVQIVLLFCMAGLVFYASYVFWTFHRELPYVPTPYSVIRRMIALAQVQPNDHVVDLGSGTGRIVLEVARLYPVEVTGIERSPLLLSAARLREWCTRKKGSARFVRGDFFCYPLEDTTVVFCFLVSRVINRLLPRFATLPQGARIVSYKFPIPFRSGWREECVMVGRSDRVYLYTKMQNLPR